MSYVVCLYTGCKSVTVLMLCVQFCLQHIHVWWCLVLCVWCVSGVVSGCVCLVLCLVLCLMIIHQIIVMPHFHNQIIVMHLAHLSQIIMMHLDHLPEHSEHMHFNQKHLNYLKYDSHSNYTYTLHNICSSLSYIMLEYEEYKCESLN